MLCASIVRTVRTKTIHLRLRTGPNANRVRGGVRNTVHKVNNGRVRSTHRACSNPTKERASCQGVQTKILLDKPVLTMYAFCMTLKRIIALLREHEVQTPDQFDEVVGLPLVFIDAGCFREAWAVPNKRVVVKFPLETEKDDYRLGVLHSRNEIKRMRKIMASNSLRHLRRYIPRVQFANKNTGLILMERLDLVGKVPPDKARIVEQMFQDTFGSHHGDLFSTNVGYNGRGQIKVLDLGLI